MESRPGHGDLHVFKKQQHLLDRRIRKIDQQDLLVLMRDEVNAIIHANTDCHDKPGTALGTRH